jgi:hypothetical protein
MVAVALLALQTVQTLLSIAANGGLFARGADLFWQFVPGAGGTIIWAHLPFAIGVLLTLWLVRPVTATTPLGAVIGRGAIAAVGGAVVVVVVQLALIAVTSSSGSRVLFAAVGAFGALIKGIPLVVLGTILLWILLRRRRGTPLGG